MNRERARGGMRAQVTLRRMIGHALLCLCCASAPSAELRVPAFTAYTLPDAEGASVSEKQGLTG